MAGWNAIDGFTYQHLCASLVAMEFVVLSEFDHLLLEAKEDATDFEAYSSGGERLLVGQVKKQNEAEAFQPHQVKRYLLDWSTLDAPDAKFRLITNAHASPSLLATVVEPLMGLRAQVQDGTDRDNLPFALSPSFLARVEIMCAFGRKEHIYDQLVHGILALREHRRPTTLGDAESCADALLREVEFKSGQRSPIERQLLRKRIAEVVGLSVDEIERATAWSPKLFSAYCRRLQELLPVFSFRGAVPGSMASCVTPTLLDDNGDSKQMSEVLGALRSDRFVAFRGAPGGGKSVVMDMVLRQLLDAGELCVVLDVTSYVKGSWQPRLRTYVSDRLQVDLEPRWLDVALQQHGFLTIFVDGVSEVDEETWHATRDDLTSLVQAHRTIRICVSGRDDGRLSQLGAAFYRVPQINEAIAREIVERATSLTGIGATRFLQTLKSLLGSGWQSPLLLQLGTQYIQAASDGASRQMDRVGQDGEPISLQSLYHDWIGELARGAGGVNLDACHLVLGSVATELAKNNEVSVSRLRVLHMLAAAIEQLVAVGLFSDDGRPTPGSILKCGILVSLGNNSSVSFLHDSLRDFFVAQEVSATRTLPDLPAGVWNEAARFFSTEQVWPALIEAIACQSVVASWRLSSVTPVVPVGENCDDRTREAASYLRALADGFAASTYRLATYVSEGGVCTLRLPGDPNESRHLTLSEAASQKRSELAGVWFKEPPSSLRVALDLWVIELRNHLRNFIQDHQTLPRSRAELRALAQDDLAEALDGYGWECMDVFGRLVEVLPGNIRETVRKGVGWTGFSAEVAPAYYQTSFLGERELQRPVLYQFRGNGVERVPRPQGMRPGWTSGDAVNLLAESPADRLWEATSRALMNALRGLYQ